MTYCECEKCKNRCTVIPGIPKPQQIPKIAKHLKMSITKCLEKYFIVGWREGMTINNKQYGMIEFVYPAREGWNNKRESWGYPLLRGINCLFFKHNKCIINDVKPYECLKGFGCKNIPHSFRGDALIEWDKAWKENTINEEIKTFIESR